ncbi:hypothetical protein BC828DRAFT_372077 [Blastocladiella britannica]|nr:hypothetical protein BC828DRAFT_372077 [Blastocladiella britannica]
MSTPFLAGIEDGDLVLSHGHTEHRCTSLVFTLRLAGVCRPFFSNPHLPFLTAQIRKVQRGHRVAVLLPLSAELVLVLVALVRIGAVYCPSSTSDGGGDPWILHLPTTDVGPARPLASIRVLGPNHGAMVLSCSSALNMVPAALPLAYIVRTSGTTRPSLAMRATIEVPCTTLDAHLDEFEHAWPTRNTTIALSTPPTFDPHLIEILHALRHGLPMLVVRRLSSVLAIDKDSKRLLLSTTPSRLFLELKDADVARILRGSTCVTELYLGGERFPYARLTVLVPLNEWSIRVGNLYGTTEMSVWSGLHVLDSNLEALYTAHGVPVTPPLSGSSIDLAADGSGCVVLSSERRKCIVNGEPRTADITGDVGVVVGDGHVVVLGRSDRLVKRRGGARVSLGDLEQSACKVLNVAAACALVLNLTSDGDDTLVILVSTDRPLPPHQELYAVADMVLVYPDAFPMTANGKRDLRALATWARTQLATNQSDPAAALTRALNSVLGTDTWAHADYFTALGGDSVRAVAIIQQTAFTIDIGGDLEAMKTMLFGLLMHEPLSCVFSMVTRQPNNPPSSPPRKRRRLLLDQDDSDRLVILDHVDLGKCVDATPTLVGPGIVMVGSHADQWCAYDACALRVVGRGHLPSPPPPLGAEDQWHRLVHRIEGRVRVHPHDPSLALVPTLSGTLFCVKWNTQMSDSTSSREWQHDLGGGEPIKCPPAVDDQDHVWIGTHAGTVWRGAPALGGRLDWRQRWTLQRGAVSAPLLMLGHGRAIAATTTGTLALLDATRADDDKPVWCVNVESPVFAAPLWVPHSETVLVLTVRQALVISVETGVVVRDRALLHPVFSHPQVIPGTDGQLAVFGSHAARVHVMDTQTLDVVWELAVPSAVFAAVWVSAGKEGTALIAFSCTDGTIGRLSLVLTRLAGPQWTVLTHSYWSVKLPAEVFSGPVAITTENQGERLLVGCRDNRLYALGSKGK